MAVTALCVPQVRRVREELDWYFTGDKLRRGCHHSACAPKHTAAPEIITKLKHEVKSLVNEVMQTVYLFTCSSSKCFLFEEAGVTHKGLNRLCIYE